MSTDYEVIIESFADRHFIRTFSKKYKKAWEFSLSALVRELQSFDVISQKSIAETIVDSEEIKICKVEFKISGTPQSRHGSGNRCIVAVHKDACRVYVLLVYHKNDLVGANEIVAWKNLIRENYAEYRGMV